MNILILSHAQYITVGLPKIIEFAEALVCLGHSVTLTVTSRRNRWNVRRHMKNGLEIIESPSWMFGKLRHGADPFDALCRIFFLKNRSFDVVHCVASRPTVFYPGLLQKRRTGAVLIYEWEDSFTEGGVVLERSGRLYYRLFGWIERYYEESLLKYADGVIVVSDFLKERALRLGVKKEKILKQVKGSKILKEPLPDKVTARNRLNNGYEKYEIILTYAGSIYESDLELLFNAFQKVLLENPKLRLQLVGYNRKMPSHIPAHTVILPRIPEDEYWLRLAASDLFVLPLKCTQANISRYPSKIGDFLTAGRPIIATPIPQVMNIMLNGQCGFISKDDSAIGFADAMRQAFGVQEKWEQLGLLARSYAKDNLSWSIVAHSILEFYLKYLDKMEENRNNELGREDFSNCCRSIKHPYNRS